MTIARSILREGLEEFRKSSSRIRQRSTRVLWWKARSQKGPVGISSGSLPSLSIAWREAKTPREEQLANLACAIAVATGLLSNPAEDIPNRRAAKFVVPRPQYGSKIHFLGSFSRASIR